MITIKQNDVVTICGMRGTGKTHLMSKIVDSTDSYFIYDAMHDFKKKAYITSNFNDALNNLRKGSQKIIYRPRQISINEFDLICKSIYARGNIMLFTDEADRVMPSRGITKNASALFDLGRHRNIGAVSSTRRLAELDKLPISQSHHVMAFKTILPNDIKFLKEFIGDIAEQARNLKNYQFLYFNGNETIVHEPI